MLCKLWLANLMVGCLVGVVNSQNKLCTCTHICVKSTHYTCICVAPIYKPHIVCSDCDGMHGSISPDAINFTIKYMLGGG